MSVKNILLFILVFNSFIFGNTKFEALKIKEEVKIDGILNDSVWEKAIGYSTYKSYYPGFGKNPEQKTIVYLAYDSKNLYFAFKCFETGKVEAKLRNRDTIFSDEDYVGVLLDSYNDSQNAYGFLVNPLGVQGDLMISKKVGIVNDETKDFIQQSELSQDYVWKSAGKITDYGYCVELAIPYKSIRFKPSKRVEMGISFIRQLTGISTKVSCPEFNPEQGTLLNQFGSVIYKGLTYQRSYEILPSIVYQHQSSNQEGNLQSINSKASFGVTGKIVLTPSLTLDAALNPDYSQVEADASLVSINLRTENYFAEKRQFFMEGSEKFEIAGTGEDRAINKVVHTRTIIDPSAGLKLTGKIGDDNSFVGLFASDQSTKEREFEPSEMNAEFGILRYKRLLKQGSYAGLIYSSRFHENGYNQIAGIDTKLNLSRRSTIQGNFLKSFNKKLNQTDIASSHNLDLEWKYRTRNYDFSVGLHDIGKEFELQTGHLNRDGVSSVAIKGSRRFFVNNKFLKMIQPGIANSYIQFDKYDEQTEYHLELNTNLFLIKNTFLQVFAQIGNESFDGKLFRNDGYGFFIMSQPLKLITFRLSISDTGKPYYMSKHIPSMESFQGDSRELFGEIEFNLGRSFKSAFRIIRAKFFRRSDQQEMFDFKIYRNLVTFQINKYLSFRGIIEYNVFSRQLTTDLLASFTYIPGTVVFAGYGSMYNSTEWNPASRIYTPADNFLEMKRGFYLKASYNWRF